MRAGEGSAVNTCPMWEQDSAQNTAGKLVFLQKGAELTQPVSTVCSIHPVSSQHSNTQMGVKECNRAMLLLRTRREQTSGLPSTKLHSASVRAAVPTQTEAETLTEQNNIPKCQLQGHREQCQGRESLKGVSTAFSHERTELNKSHGVSFPTRHRW